MNEKNEQGKPVYYDGSGLESVIFVSANTKKESISKPEGVVGEEKFPYFPYFKEPVQL